MEKSKQSYSCTIELCEEGNKMEILKDSYMDQNSVKQIDIVYIDMNNLSAKILWIKCYLKHFRMAHN